MRTLGIIAPTALEAEVLVRRLRAVEVRRILDKSFYRAAEGSVVMCVSGIGKVNAAYATCLLIEHFRPDVVVAVGVAGAYPSSGLNIADVVVADREVYGDEGLLTNEGFVSVEDLGWPLLSGAESRDARGFPLSVPEGLRDWRYRGTSVTVSTCTGTLDRACHLEKTHAALCENMEGAAVAHVAAACGVPAAEVRGISNIIKDRKPGPLSRTDIRAAAERVQEFFLESSLCPVR